MPAELADFIDAQCRLRGAEGHLRIFPRARRPLRQGPVSSEPEFQAACRCVALARLSARAGDGGRTGRGRAAPGRCRAIGHAQVEAIARARACGVRPLSGAGGARRSRSGASCAPSSSSGCKLIGLHPPKWAKDIPEPFWRSLFRPDADPRKAARAATRRRRETICASRWSTSTIELTKRMDARRSRFARAIDLPRSAAGCGSRELSLSAQFRRAVQPVSPTHFV